MPATHLLLSPLLIYMLAGIGCLIFNHKVNVQRIIGLGASGFALFLAILLLKWVDRYGLLYFQVGALKTPYGITVIADRFSAIMVCITALLGFVTMLYSISDRQLKIANSGKVFHPSLFFMLMGITGAFITGDLFNLYVWFEVMLVASFVLITLGGNKEQLQGGLKYVVINFVASSFLLLAIGVLYSTTGNINLAALSESLKETELFAITQIAAIFLLISFGIKAALFPLYFWLPTAYHTPPPAITAVVSGLLSKVGVYAIFRIYTLLFPLSMNPYLQYLLLFSSGITMLVGVLGAIIQLDLRKILSFNLVSKIGLIVGGFVLYTPAGLVGSIYYILQHILVKTNLFFLTGAIGQVSNTYDIKKMNGLYDKFPIFSFLFMLLSLVLTGVPPFSGFWGKLMLLKASFEVSNYWLALIILLTSFLTLYSMIRVWGNAFLPKIVNAEQFIPEPVFIRENSGMILAMALLFLLSMIISFYPGPLIDYLKKTAEQLLNPDQYIDAVLERRK